MKKWMSGTGKTSRKSHKHVHGYKKPLTLSQRLRLLTKSTQMSGLFLMYCIKQKGFTPCLVEYIKIGVMNDDDYKY